MKNFLIKLISIIVAVSCLLSVVACKGGDDTGGINNTPNTNVNKPEVQYSEGMLVQNGKSDYKLLMPAEPSVKENLALTEFNELFLLSTGITLNTVYEDGTTTFTSEDKIISIGDTKFAQSLGVNPTYAQLGSQGYMAKTIDNCVVIKGASRIGYGTLYGVYDFLARQIGFECYAEDETYVLELEEANLVKMDVVDKPDVALFNTPSGAYGANSKFRYRNRYVAVSEIFTGGMTMYHSSFHFLPPDTYKADNPDWYATSGSQICYTAKGNPQSYNKMLNTLFDIFLTAVLNYPEIEQIGFCIEDNRDFCACSKCNSELARYGANSAVVIKFMNDLSDKFAEYLQANNLERNLNFMFFAYKPTFNAPINHLEEVTCNDNVYPFVCTFDADRVAAFTDEVNQQTYNNIEGWGKVCNQMSFWTYSANYLNYNLPYDPFNCLQANLQYVKTKNPVYYKDESSGDNYNSTGFNTLKHWLNYKLAWNTELNMSLLIDEYFEHYFKDAAQPMMEYFTRYRMALSKAYNLYGYTHMDHSEMPKDVQTCFTHGELKYWKSLIEKCYDKIEYLKNSNVEEYNKLYKRITLESILIDYTILDIHRKYYSEYEVAAMKEQLKANSKLCMVSWHHDSSDSPQDGAIDLM